MSEIRTADELLDGLIECARKAADMVRPGDGEYHLRNLLKIRDWAFAEQPHQPGDRVKLVEEIDFTKAYGWRPYADHLQVGAVGTVESIGFGNGWYANVRLDSMPEYVFGLAQSRLGRVSPE